MAARARINELLDVNSFIENEPLMADTGLVWGYGTVNGRIIFVYAQYDAIGLSHAKQIAKTYISAIKVGAPVIGVHSSKGVRLEEGLDCLEAFGIIFSAQSEASGVVPQISVIAGDCIGSSAFIPALSDFKFKLNKTCYFFAGSDSYANAASAADMQKNAGVDFCFDNEQDMLAEVKKLISYLPSNCLELAPETDSLPDSQDKGKDCDILHMIADGGDFIEIKKSFARDTRTGFVRLDGYSVGFIKYGGDLTSEALEKASNFVRICDSFNIPIISFTDINGFGDIGTDADFITKGASLIHVYASASVPKISVITGNSVGAACLLANGGFFSADIIYAWPDSLISPITPDAAKEVFGYTLQSAPALAAAKGYINDIISTEDTRSRLISGLNMLANKRVSRLTKKHGTIL